MRTEKSPLLKAISVLNRTLVSGRAFAPLDAAPIGLFPGDFLPLALPAIFDPSDLELRSRAPFSTVKPFIFMLLVRVPNPNTQLWGSILNNLKIRWRRRRYNNFSRHWILSLSML